MATVEAPDELPPEEPPLLVVGAAPATEGVPEVGPALATAPTPPVCGPLSGTCAQMDERMLRQRDQLRLTVTSLAPMLVAADVKAAFVPLPLDGALMVPTIPRPQCVGNLQKKYTAGEK